LQNWTIEPLTPALTNSSVQPATPGEVSLTLNANGPQHLQGTQQLARLHFTATAGQTSAFIPLNIEDVICDRAQAGLEPSSIVNNNRIVVIGTDSLLEAVLSASGQRQLIIYGPAGSYIIETSTDPRNGWTTWQQVTTTSLTHTVPLPNNQANVFYRLRRP